MTDFERVVYIPDVHAPFEDPEAVSVALGFLREFRPDRVFVLGDFIDFYSISRFLKDPRRRLLLQDEIDHARALLAEFRAAWGDAEAYYIQGNHENRLTKYLCGSAPELASLRCLDFRELMGLKALDIGYVPAGWYDDQRVIVKHGKRVRMWSAYSARGEWERVLRSGVSGHTHRLGQFYRRGMDGMYSWTEAGCLCDLDPEYLEGELADWQHGLAYGYFEKGNGRYEIHVTPIIHGRMIWGGKEIRAAS